MGQLRNSIQHPLDGAEVGQLYIDVRSGFRKDVQW